MSRSEAWLLCLDALPILLSVLVWLVLHPSSLLARIRVQPGPRPASSSSSLGNSSVDMEKQGSRD